jgi:nitrogen regulatory protein PII
MEFYRGVEYEVNFVPKIKIEVVVPRDIADSTIARIQEAARTGEIGDGKIFVMPVEEGIRICTGEMSTAAAEKKNDKNVDTTFL